MPTDAASCLAPDSRPSLPAEGLGGKKERFPPPTDLGSRFSPRFFPTTDLWLRHSMPIFSTTDLWSRHSVPDWPPTPVWTRFPPRKKPTPGLWSGFSPRFFTTPGLWLRFSALVSGTTDVGAPQAEVRYVLGLPGRPALLGDLPSCAPESEPRPTTLHSHSGDSAFPRTISESLRLVWHQPRAHRCCSWCGARPRKRNRVP